MSFIPGGASTASKSPSRYVDMAPKAAVSGIGCRFYDVNGHLYLDFGMALGACILGYGEPHVAEAVSKAATNGMLFTLPSHLEEIAAEILLDYVPWADKLRWAKNGTDVTTAAVRLARYVTDRRLVVSAGYHGWGHWSLPEPAYGIPQLEKNMTVHVPVNVWPPVEIQDFSRVAAVVVEVAANAELNESYLEKVRATCDANGTILVFDEVLSGFRYKMGSASSVVPDLACFGKSIANGMPLAALVGSRELMKGLKPGRVFFSGTGFGETLSLTACIETLRIMDEERVPEHIREVGLVLRDSFSHTAEAMNLPIRCVGDGPRTRVVGLDHKQSDLFQQVCAMNGLLYMGAHNMSLAHRLDDVGAAMVPYLKAMSAVARVWENPESELIGEPTVVPYRVQ